MPKISNSRKPETDPDRGLYRGQLVARRYESPDGWTILVGKAARFNDILTFKLAAATDFWLHIKSQPGSHVVIRNPLNLDRAPRETERFAAALAARFSSAKNAGNVAVSIARLSDVRKPRGAATGSVVLRKSRILKVSARDAAPRT